MNLFHSCGMHSTKSYFPVPKNTFYSSTKALFCICRQNIALLMLVEHGIAYKLLSFFIKQLCFQCTHLRIATSHLKGCVWFITRELLVIKYLKYYHLFINFKYAVGVPPPPFPLPFFALQLSSFLGYGIPLLYCSLGIFSCNTKLLIYLIFNNSQKVDVEIFSQTYSSSSLRFGGRMGAMLITVVTRELLVIFYLRSD